MRCRSSMAPASCTVSASAETTTGPSVIGGTKWPSITSTWITRAPASSTSETCSRRRPKSAERIDGATRTLLRSSEAETVMRAHYASDFLKHRVPAVVALEDRGGGHPHDRGVLAAVGAHGCELEAVQAVDAAVAPGKVRRAQPRLAAVGALRAEVDVRSGRRLRLALHRSAPSQSGYEEACRPVAVRQGRDDVIEREFGLGIQKRGDQALILGGRDRARRVDKHASRT